LTGAHHYLFDPINIPKVKKGTPKPKCRLSGVSWVNDVDAKGKKLQKGKESYFQPIINTFPTVKQLISDLEKTQMTKMKNGRVVVIQKHLKDDQEMDFIVRYPNGQVQPILKSQLENSERVPTPIGFKKVVSVDLRIIKSYLESLTLHPETTKIGCLRKVRRKDQHPNQFAKPAWAANVMKRLNLERKKNKQPLVKYVLDFGTDKTVLTNSDGVQNEDFYAEYKNEQTTNVSLKKGKYKDATSC
jgi:hypothetical protein